MLREVQFQHPQMLLALLGVIPLLAVLCIRSRTDSGRAGRRISMVLRVLWLCLGLLALAGPFLRHRTLESGMPPVVILSDYSQSVGPAGPVDAIRRRLQAQLPSGTPVTELCFAASTWRPGETAGKRDQTDIAAALDAANGRTLEQRAPRVIVLTDGRATCGDAVEAARRLAMRGGHVYVVPVGFAREQRPSIAGTEPPAQVQQGVASAVRATISSPIATQAEIRLLDPDGEVADQRVIPVHGQSTLLLRFTSAKPGLREYRLEMRTLAADGTAQRMETLPVLVFVQGPPRILIVDPFPEESQPLQHALAPLKIPVDLVAPKDFPADTGPYAAIIVSDFSGKELTPDQRGDLRRFVEQRGGGLVFIAGGNVMASHWRGNPLSEMLPVALEEKKAKVVKDVREVAVCFVFDRSGSMGGGLPSNSGPEVRKLDLVKASILASLHGLPEGTKVAAVSFDTKADVVVQPTDVADREAIGKRIDSVSVGGGTEMEPAVRQGLRLLAGMRGEKYMIVLTDGQVEQGVRWRDVAGDVKQQGVSWTSIAVGLDADRDLMRSLAQQIGGRYFYCDSADQIPKVFMDEAKAIRRIADVAEQPFRPRPGPALDRLRDLKVDEMPLLQGRAPCRAKPAVQVVLLSEQSDPLYAAWQFGAGRVVAFTSDAKSAWARQWLAWTGFSAFWVQTVQGVLRPEQPFDVRTRSYRSGNVAKYHFVVTDPQGRPVSSLKADGIVTAGPSAPASLSPDPRVRWTEEAPGEYLATVRVPSDSRISTISLRLRRDDQHQIRYLATVSLPQDPELAATGPDMSSLQEIATAGGGFVTGAPDTIAAACSSNPARELIHDQPLWPWLLIIALVLWPLDLLIRKVL